MESEDGYALTPVTSESLAPLRGKPRLGETSEALEMGSLREEEGGREGYEIVSDPFVPFPDEPGIQEERLDRILIASASL